ncbi:MAG: hypothetical protein CMF96_02325 [Candidatus Marinimicrobia bacterium]|nr:hypothetical protein [Candidatus Neomarinimicrobiota bacterium]
MINFKSIIIGFLSASCIFLFMGMTDKEINQKKKWLKEFPENGRYLPVMNRDRVWMMDSKTGNFYTSRLKEGDQTGSWTLDTKLSK